MAPHLSAAELGRTQVLRAAGRSTAQICAALATQIARRGVAPPDARNSDRDAVTARKTSRGAAPWPSVACGGHAGQAGCRAAGRPGGSAIGRPGGGGRAAGRPGGSATGRLGGGGRAVGRPGGWAARRLGDQAARRRASVCSSSIPVPNQFQTSSKPSSKLSFLYKSLCLHEASV